MFYGMAVCVMHHKKNRFQFIHIEFKCSHTEANQITQPSPNRTITTRHNDDIHKQTTTLALGFCFFFFSFLSRSNQNIYSKSYREFDRRFILLSMHNNTECVVPLKSREKLT